MSKFKAFERKAGHIAGKVAKKSSELAESGKLKLMIAREEHTVNELYYKIGEKVYNEYQDGEIPAFLAEEFAAVAAHKAKAEELRASACAGTAEDYDDGDIIIDITADDYTEEEADSEE